MYVSKGARLESVWLFVWSQSTPHKCMYLLEYFAMIKIDYFT